MKIHVRLSILSFLVSLILSGCSSTPVAERRALDNPWYRPPDPSSQDRKQVLTPDYSVDGDSYRLVNEVETQNPEIQPKYQIFESSGALWSAAQGAEGEEADKRPGGVTLNFRSAEISEIVKTILGDILKRNYVIDERVRGEVYLQTSAPLQTDQLLPTLEALLRINGAVLRSNGSFYEIVPIESAMDVGFTPSGNLEFGAGYQMLVLPLRYIAASEMLKILQPLKPAQGMLEADSHRNLLIAAGRVTELVNIRETVSTFDVDQLQGMSVGLFRLESVTPDKLITELDALFGDPDTGPLAGYVRFLPIERLNSLLVITPQTKYLKDVRDWIDRLDRAEASQGLNLYVYYVQNGKAEKLAAILTDLFENRRSALAGRPAVSNDSPSTSSTEPKGTRVGAIEPVNRRSNSPTANSGTSVDVGDVSVISDEESNSLLILATPQDYEKVQVAINKLDVLPMQVLVEATILEVKLEDELRYGLQWFFKTSLGGDSAIGSLGNTPLLTPSGLFPTANFEVFDSNGTNLLLNLLAEDSKLKVISSPSLMVLDNRTATIRVGAQVPVRTSETTSNASDNLNTTSTIQFRDTGVLLEVTPRVNAGGMVVLDIKQEVNDVDQTTSSGIDSPTIIQRQIQTSVAVKSGETLVLGGLIKDISDQSASGVPGIRHVPVLGWFFGSEGQDSSRTELVVLITPTAVADAEEARDVTDEYRQKLQNIDFEGI